MRKAIPLLFVLAAAVLATGCGKAAGPDEWDALLERSWRAYSTGDFDVAIAGFTAVANAPGGDAAQDYSALLGLATTHHLRTSPDLDKAREAYARVADLGTDDARKQSLLGLARNDIATNRVSDGQAQLMTLVREYPADREADEATIHLAVSLLAPTASDDAAAGFALAATARSQRGARVLEERLRTHPDNSLAAAMHILLANHYVAGGQMRTAIEHLVAAEQRGISGVKTHSTVLWQIARIAENELKDYDLAEHYYERYTQEFRRTVLYYRALESLERVRKLKAAQGA